MRLFARIVTVFTALAMLSFLPGLGTPASADSAKAPVARSDAGSKGKAKVTAKVVGDGPLYIRGQVKGGNVKFITIQKATKCTERAGCNFRQYRKVKGQGPKDKYKVKITAPPRGEDYWRAKIKGDTSKIWRTYQL